MPSYSLYRNQWGPIRELTLTASNIRYTPVVYNPSLLSWHIYINSLGDVASSDIPFDWLLDLQSVTEGFDNLGYATLTIIYRLQAPINAELGFTGSNGHILQFLYSYPVSGEGSANDFFDVVNDRTDDDSVLAWPTSLNLAPTLLAFPTGVILPGNTSNVIPTMWPCIAKDCPPGKLIQEPPVIAGQFQNDAGLPLQGQARYLIEGMPGFFARGRCSVLARTLKIIGAEADALKLHTETIVSDSLFNPELNESHLFYTCNTPEIYLSNLSVSAKVEFYDTQINKWIPLHRAITRIEVTDSAGPCFYLDNDKLALFANLERLTYKSNGIASGNIYVHTFSNDRLKDKDIYTAVPGYQKLRKGRWDRLSPESMSHISGFHTSTHQQLWVSIATTPPTSGYTLRWKKDDIIVGSIAKVTQELNSWDNLASLSNLKRRTGEDNLSLRNRIYSVRLFNSSGIRKESVIDIARHINQLELVVWDGINDYNLASLYPDITSVLVSGLREIDYRYETLRPVGDLSNTYTSDKRQWEQGETILVNGSVWPGRITNNDGVLQFDGIVNGSVTAQYAARNWQLSGGHLISSLNVSQGKYPVAIVRGITLNSLASIKHTRLFSGGVPTLFGLQILKTLSDLRPIGYSRGKWGTASGRFFTTKEAAPLATRIPLAFED